MTGIFDLLVPLPRQADPRTSKILARGKRTFERERERERDILPAMAERSDETLIEKIAGKVHGSDFSSDLVHNKPKPSESSLKAKIYGLFGRERPVHKVFGGGKLADLFLWRDKKASSAVLGGATIIWVLFELMEYHLLTLLCHCLILSLSILFLWSNATTFIKKSPPQIPQLSISEDLVVNIARSLRFEINRSLAILREIASGHDLKKFLAVIAGFWVLSIIGSCTSFLTILYIGASNLGLAWLGYEEILKQQNPSSQKKELILHVIISQEKEEDF